MSKTRSDIKKIAKSLDKVGDELKKISRKLENAIDEKEKKGSVEKKKQRTVKQKKQAKSVKKASGKRTGGGVGPGSPKKKAPAKRADGATTVLERVLDVIKHSKNGETIAALKTKTNLESRQLSNALYKLSKKGKIKAKTRGTYIKA
jgi:predicted Rossmann fold nucleotide-binding protein DprA/Smf involved in DNA uptake